MVKIKTPKRARDTVLENTPDLIAPSDGLAREAAFQEAFETSVGPSVFRAARRLNAGFGDLRDLQTGQAENVPTMLEPGVANERYGIPGELSFDRRISEREAAEFQAIKQRELYRRNLIAASDLGTVESFAVGAAGTLADPATLATAFIPASWFGRAAFLAKGGAGARAASRAAAGATEGLVVGAAIEGAVLPILQGEGRDYDLGDSLAAVFFSTVLGGALTPGLGAIGDALGGVPRQAGARSLDDIPLVTEPEEIAGVLRQQVRAQAAAQRASVDAATVTPINRKAAAIKAEAAAKAVDDLAGGNPVDVVPLIRKMGQEEGIIPPGARILDDGPPSQRSLSSDVPARTLSDAADPAPTRTFADIADEAGEASTPRALGTGTAEDQITALRADPELALARTEIDDALASGRLTDDDVLAAQAEVRAALGAPERPLADDEIGAAYQAAVNCALGR